MVKLAPGLEEQKRNTQRALEEETQKVVQIEDLIPKLEGQKKKLQDEIKQKQEEILQIDGQLEFFSQLKTRKR